MHVNSDELYWSALTVLVHTGIIAGVECSYVLWYFMVLELYDTTRFDAILYSTVQCDRELYVTMQNDTVSVR